MRIRSPKDFWSGLVFIAIAVAFMALAARYRLGTAEKMGPGFFPIMIGIVQAGLGAILLGRSFVLDGPPLERMRLSPLAITVVAVVLFGIALNWLGLTNINVPTMTNDFAGGALTLGAEGLTFKVGGFLEGTGAFAITGKEINLEGSAKITIPGGSEGLLTIKRDPKGGISGSASMAIAA